MEMNYSCGVTICSSRSTRIGSDITIPFGPHFAGWSNPRVAGGAEVHGKR